jgi:hypothetical protein
MPAHVDTDAVRTAAKAIFDKRVDAVVKIAEAHQTLLDKREEVAAAEREHASRWAAGLREGWTEAELKGMKLVPPARNARGRPSGRRAARADNANGAAPAPAVEPAAAE